MDFIATNANKTKKRLVKFTAQTIVKYKLKGKILTITADNISNFRANNVAAEFRAYNPQLQIQLKISQLFYITHVLQFVKGAIY